MTLFVHYFLSPVLVYDLIFSVNEMVSGKYYDSIHRAPLVGTEILRDLQSTRTRSRESAIVSISCALQFSLRVLEGLPVLRGAARRSTHARSNAIVRALSARVEL